LLGKGRHLLRKMGHARHAPIKRGHMHDQRVVGGAAFGGKYLSHRSFIGGIGPQTVHRLGWQAN
jgi:hypothetical protein